MEMTATALIMGFLISTVGFSLFLYGKKQARLPQLVAGCLMMLEPFVVRDALWMSVAGLVSVVGMWLAIRQGC